VGVCECLRGGTGFGEGLCTLTTWLLLIIAVVRSLGISLGYVFPESDRPPQPNSVQPITVCVLLI